MLASAETGASIAGVQKVIQMLTDMSEKGKQAKKAEEVAFAEFETWCSMESANLNADIRKGAEQIELLSAAVDKLGSDIKGMRSAIAGLQSDISGRQADLTAETTQREKDHTDFSEQERDFSDSVDAIERALIILAKQDYDRPAAAAALLQLSAAERLPEKIRSIAEAFIGMTGGSQNGEDPLGGMDYSAPEANAYEFQSDNIIAILKRLRDEFRSKLATCQKEEVNSQQAFDMIVADLKDAIRNAERDAGEKTVEKARDEEKKALDEKSLQSTIAVKADDEKTLSEMTTECHEKKFSFLEKQQLRTEELEAIAKAIEVLKSPEVLGNAERYLDLAQARPSSATSLLQMGDRSAAGSAATEGSQGVRHRLHEFLSKEGERLHSRSLALLAQKLQADPFVKVKQMIQAMVTRLLDEANEDAKHEGFCDEEMGKSAVTRTKLSEEIDALTAVIEGGQATIWELTESTAQLSKEIQDLEAAMAQATGFRTAEKTRNAETVKDAQAAQAAVAAATAVLKDFYAKASTATGFLQGGLQGSLAASTPRRWGLKTRVKMGTDEWDSLANPDFKGVIDKGHQEGMQTFGRAELGQQDEASYGVLGLLEIIAADFATLEAETDAEEAAAAQAYDRLMAESKKSHATKAKSVEMNEADRAAAEAKLQEDTADLKSTQDELLAADRYHARLVPQCIDQGMTWEERVAARQAEIDSLKEALQILGSSDVA